jgi:hypothetical protein
VIFVLAIVHVEELLCGHLFSDFDFGSSRMTNRAFLSPWVIMPHSTDVSDLL